jgi:hypothetical protein
MTDSLGDNRHPDMDKNFLLKNVHPLLRQLADEVYEASPVKFIIIEGLRTLETQQRYYKEGKTRTLNSPHLADKRCGWSNAIDIMPVVEKYGREKTLIEFRDGRAVNTGIQKDIYFLIGCFYGIANKFNIKIRVGALWDSDSIWTNDEKTHFVDAYHIEIK